MENVLHFPPLHLLQGYENDYERLCYHLCEMYEIIEQYLGEEIDFDLEQILQEWRIMNLLVDEYFSELSD